MATERNVKVNNLVQTIVQHPASRETINLISTATNQEQSTNIVLIVSAEIPECEGASRHPAFMGNCQTISHTC